MDENKSKDELGKVTEAKIVEEPKKELKKKRKIEVKRQNDTDVVWAIFLISIGVIFLMNSFGLLTWGIWSVLWRFWPVMLILGGVQLLLGKSVFSKVLTAIFAVVIINLVLFTSILSLSGDMRSWVSEWLGENAVEKIADWTNFGGDLKTETNTVNYDDYEDVEARRLNLNIGASEFKITDDKSFDDYLLVDSSFYEGYNEPEVESSFEDGELTINFDTDSSPRTMLIGRFDNVMHEFTFGQADLKTDIYIDLGAGKGSVELEDLNVSQLKADIGAGKIDLNLAEESLPSDKVVLDVGAGSARIVLPENVGLKLTYDVGAGSLKVDSEKISGIGKDGVYETDEFSDAELKVEFDVRIGAGKVEIVRE